MFVQLIGPTYAFFQRELPGRPSQAEFLMDICSLALRPTVTDRALDTTYSTVGPVFVGGDRGPAEAPFTIRAAQAARRSSASLRAVLSYLPFSTNKHPSSVPRISSWHTSFVPHTPRWHV